MNEEQVLKMLKNDEGLKFLLEDDKNVELLAKAIMNNKENDNSIDRYFYEMAETLIKTLLYYIKSLGDDNQEKISKCLEIIKNKDFKNIITNGLKFGTKGRILADSVLITPEDSLETIRKIAIEKMEGLK